MDSLIDGKMVAKKIREEVKVEVEELKNSGLKPCLAVVLVGEDPASRVYVKNKQKACQEVGIESKEIVLPEKTSQKELIHLVEKLNSDSSVNGILVQLPLPNCLSEAEVINSISPLKDVDGFHPLNFGRLFIGQDCFVPCTPFGIIKLLEHYNLEVSGKNCVVVGRSNIVGKPIASLLLKKNATVTVCHSKTENIGNYTKNADILIVAVGKPNFIGKDMVKKGAVIIDVGINRMPDGKLCGDVNFAEALEVAGLITPVPGGVGPMTIAMLLKNTLKAAKLQNNIF